MHSLVAHDAVLLPFGENTRYDLVIDTGATFERIQCKTGRLKSGVVIFATASTYAHHPNPKIHRRGYENEIDYFGVYCPTNGGVYLVPISDVSTTTSAILRIESSRPETDNRAASASPTDTRSRVWKLDYVKLV